MAATAARLGMTGLARKAVIVRPTDMARLFNQAGLTSRSFSVRACSPPSTRPSIRSMYSGSAISSVRAFSLWPSAGTPNASGTVSVEPSPDARASQTEQFGDLTNNSTPDLSAFETSTGPAIHDMGSSIAEVAEHVQTLADLGKLSSWPNVRLAQWLLDGTVELTGLPWWATIALVTLSIRILVLPLVFKGQANAIRLQNIQPKMGAYMKDIQYAKATGNKVLLSESAMAVQKLMKDNKCSPFKSLYPPLILGPIFASFFFALKGLGEAGLTSMQTGGLAWFNDLTAADPYMILPTASILMSLAVIETGAEMGSTSKAVTPQAKFLRNAFRVLIPASLFFFAYFPAAIFCYMGVNNTFSLLQLLTLQAPAVRKYLNLPKKIEHEPEETNGKQLSFWDSIKAGGASQTSANAVSRSRVPAALQTRQQLEQGREAALRKIVQSQPPSDRRRAGQPTIRASAPIDAESSIQGTQPDNEQVSSYEVEPEYDQEEADRQARLREKQKRVQAARQKRKKQ
jgi:YidC/Oxa1 family membrane protein insertase